MKGSRLAALVLAVAVLTGCQARGYAMPVETSQPIDAPQSMPR